MGRIAVLETKFNATQNQFTILKEKYARLFSVTYSKRKSQKRKLKQNKRKVKKNKSRRMEENSFQHLDPIGPLALNYEAIASLSKRKLIYLLRICKMNVHKGREGDY